MLDAVLNVINVTVLSALRLTTLASISAIMSSTAPTTTASGWTLPAGVVERYQHQRIPLLIGGFFPLSGNDRRVAGVGNAAQIAAQMALDDIRRSKHILKAYNLSMVPEDTQCKASEGTKAFFDMMSAKPPKLALFGDMCTEVNEPIAMTAHYWNMVQVSYGETHPKFSSTDKREKYPTFYNMVPSRKLIRIAQYRFLETFNWTKIATLLQEDKPSYALPQDRFTSAFEQERSENKVVADETFLSSTTNFSEQFSNLKRKDARIIFTFFEARSAHAIFCEAYHQKMYGENYVWILLGYHDDLWWRNRSSEAKQSCSNAQFLEALNGHFIMEFVRSRPYKDRLVSKGIQPPMQFERKFHNLCKKEKICEERSEFATYSYDGIWTIGIALDKILTDLYFETGELFDPREVTADSSSFNETSWKKRLMDALNATNFQGLTGGVRFDDNERLGRIRIAQFQNRTYINVGDYDSTTDRFYLNQFKILWAAGSPPVDQTRIEVQYRYVNFMVYCAMCALATFGMVLALLFFSINIHFRDHKFIKMSSPNLNNVIIFGSLLTYLSVILLGVDTQMVSEDGFRAVCNIKAWVLCSGFTLAFGSMFSKTWRVHSIFTNIKLNKKAIKDYQLFLVVGVLLAVDFIILGAWLIADPMYKQEKNLQKERDVQKNLEVHPIVEHCDSNHAPIFQGIIFCYKGLLLVLGCFLAWETRNVNVPALNDSKFIGMSVYNVVIMCSIGVALSFILQDQVNESYILISIFIIFCTTLTLCLVFGPKIFELIVNPKGSDAKSYRKPMMRTPSKVGGGGAKTDDAAELKDKLRKVEQEVTLSRRRLEEKSSEVEQVVKSLQLLGYKIEDSDSAIDNGSSVEPSSHDAGDFGGIYLGPSEGTVQNHVFATKTVSLGAAFPRPPPPSGACSPVPLSSVTSSATLLAPGTPIKTLQPDDVTELTSLLPSVESRPGSIQRKNALARFRSSLTGSTKRSGSQEQDENGDDSSRPSTIYYSFPTLAEDLEAHAANGPSTNVPMTTFYAQGTRLRHIDSSFIGEDDGGGAFPASPTLPSVNEAYAAAAGQPASLRRSQRQRLSLTSRLEKLAQSMLRREMSTDSTASQASELFHTAVQTPRREDSGIFYSLSPSMYSLSPTAFSSALETMELPAASSSIENTLAVQRWLTVHEQMLEVVPEQSTPETSSSAPVSNAKHEEAKILISPTDTAEIFEEPLSSLAHSFEEPLSSLPHSFEEPLSSLPHSFEEPLSSLPHSSTSSSQSYVQASEELQTKSEAEQKAFVKQASTDTLGSTSEYAYSVASHVSSEPMYRASLAAPLNPLQTRDPSLVVQAMLGKLHRAKAEAAERAARLEQEFLEMSMKLPPSVCPFVVKTKDFKMFTEYTDDENDKESSRRNSPCPRDG